MLVYQRVTGHTKLLEFVGRASKIDPVWGSLYADRFSTSGTPGKMTVHEHHLFRCEHQGGCQGFDRF